MDRKELNRIIDDKLNQDIEDHYNQMDEEDEDGEE